MEHETTTIRFSSKYAEAAKVFFEIYRGDHVVVCPQSKMTGFKDKRQRICRFCKRKWPEVTFRNDAHLLPMFLGNKYLTTDFECDSCNLKFSRFEDDLSKFFGITRTIARTKGRKDVPGFVSPDLMAKRALIFGNPDAIKVEPVNSNAGFIYDPEKRLYTLNYKKEAYIPINVFKALLKMALCLIPESEVNNYRYAFEFLMTKKLDGKFKPLMLFIHSLPNSYQELFAILFSKKQDAVNSPSHTFILFYNRFMLQIFLPLYVNDFKHHENMNLLLLPPLFDGTGDEKWEHIGQWQVDLSSLEKKRDDQANIVFSHDLKEDEQIEAVDPITGKLTPKNYDPTDIAGLFLVDENFSFKPQ